MKRFIPAFLMLLLGAGTASPASDVDSPAYTEKLVGKPVPDWGDLHFVDAPAHRRPEDFRGKVMVIRFWTSDCPRCRASAATLRDWTRQYRKDGLVVVGVYLPHSRHERVKDSDVRGAARNIGLDAILAADPGWDALTRLWNHAGERYAVSISLLVDRDGVVRAVHRGGRMALDAPADQAAEYRAFSDILRREIHSI